MFTPRYRVLDEVDRMMAMGFIEDVETILKAEEEHQVWDGVGGRLKQSGKGGGRTGVTTAWPIKR